VQGWAAVGRRLREAVAGTGRASPVVVVDCYVGVHDDEIAGALTEALDPAMVLSSRGLFRSEPEIEGVVASFLGGDDPIFGYLSGLTIDELVDPESVEAARAAVRQVRGTTLIVGTGARLVHDGDVLVLADLARWEAQQRQRRREVPSLGVATPELDAGRQYKRSYFVDWRVCDRWKTQFFDRIDFLLDTNRPGDPRLVDGPALRNALAHVVRRPFRLVPFFDPGPWGGHWMEEVCDLTDDAPNHAWCFDCVPEENSLRLGFGDQTVEIPALDLVLTHPRELLGAAVHRRFGAEFPIRFDFLDTMGGGHLSLQVHPLTAYVRQQFGLAYTQDESYYILDATPDSSVFLGLERGVDPDAMLAALREAEAGGPPFDVERYVNRWPAERHDHFLIPAGTVHGSGADTMVLEISSTPYLFTFKLWDWGRPGLDGRPRPINIDHGARVIQWDRDTDWVRRELIDRIEPLARGPGWREERTGLHELEFIETRRHWFRGRAPHHTAGSVDVLNLVQGAEALVESPTGAFDPFVVHYAETFVVPEVVGAYTIRPHGPAVGTECATIKARVRPDLPPDREG
jgi:hypothetical protein